MTHFHLKYFPRNGTPKTNYGSSFDSEIDVLHAAGLANATRGLESGYYGIEPCNRARCGVVRKGAVLAHRPRSLATARTRVPSRPKMLN